MRDLSKTVQELLEENASLRRQIRELEQSKEMWARTEEALRQSEQRYRTFIDSTKDMVFLKDENLRYILVNKELAAFFGKTEREIIGKTDFDLMPEQGAVSCRQTDMEAVSSASIVTSEEITGGKSYETVKFPVRLNFDRTGVGGFVRDITTRKEVETKVIESQGSLNAILTASPIGIGRVINGAVDWVNDSLCRMSGYNREELEGKNAKLFFESDAAYARAGSTLFEGGQAETRLKRKDGTVRHVLLQVSPMGNLSYIFTVIDVTAQKQTEKDLRKSEVLYRTLVETSSEILMLGDVSRNRRYVSPNVTKILGYSVEEFLTGDRADFTHPDSLPTAESARSWALDHPGETVTFETKNRHKDGSWRWFEATLRNMLEESNVNAMVVNLHDITERKRSEEYLRMSQLQLLEAMDLAHIVYWEFDPATDTFVFNDPFYAFYATTAEREGGYRMTREEYANRFIHPGDLESFYRAVRENVTQSGPELLPDVEKRIVRRDGEVRYVLTRARKVKDNLGRIVKRYGANQDITDRKQAEEERERLIVELKNAASQVQTLSGLLPICSSCKKICNDKGNWEQMEVYIKNRSQADFSHGICPECMARLYPDCTTEGTGE
ncbi:MAG TPA: PAS domain S-box protein [Syntrophorhabdaceae bacterium]|nr:PAS domain S-box protein [Syntrophorhabdaceae bacterium]